MVNETVRPFTTQRKIGISAILYLIYTSYYISGYSSRSHNYVLVALFAAWAVMALLEDMNSFRNAFDSAAMMWAIIFIGYYFLTSFLYGDIINTMEYVAKYIMLFSCVLQFKYYKIRDNYKEILFIVISILVVWAFFAIKAILFYIAVPTAARIIASDFYAFDNIAIGGGYAIAFGSAILCVYLFERLINTKFYKKSGKSIFYTLTITIALIVILFFLLIKTESTLTLIGCTLGIMCSVIRRIWRGDGKRQAVNRFVLIFVLFTVSLFVLLNVQEIGQWIIIMTKDRQNSTIFRRLYRIGQKMAVLGTGSKYINYIDERFEYIVQSWKTFLKNPIIGVGFKSGNIYSNLEKNGVGTHSAICDMLAQHGVVGFFFIVMFFIKALKKECWVKHNTYVVTMIFMCFVNPFEYFHGYLAMFTVIPILEMFNKDWYIQEKQPTNKTI